MVEEGRMKLVVKGKKKYYVCERCGVTKPYTWYETPVCFKCPEVREGVRQLVNKIKNLLEKGGNK